MAEYIPNWKGLEAYHFTGSNQAELKTQVEKNGGSTYTDDYGNFYLVIDKTKYFMPPNYVLVINEKRAGKLYKKADFDANYKDYSGGGSGGDVDKKVYIATYQQTTAQDILEFLIDTNEPFAPIVVKRGNEYHTCLLAFKKSNTSVYIRTLGTISGVYYIFNYTITNNRWSVETFKVQQDIDLSNYYTKAETGDLISNELANFDRLDYVIVDTLPTTGDAGVRYLVKEPRGNKFREWIYINDTWHDIGTTNEVNLDNYYNKAETEAWVNSQGFLKEHQDLSGYATEAWVESKNYLTSHQDLSAYAKTADVNSALSLKADKTELNGLATESWVEAKNYLTEHQDLSGYATQTWVEGRGYLTEHQDLSSYATQTWVEGKGYLTEHQDISTKQDKLTAGDGIAIDASTNTISADLSSAFKFVQKNAVAITIPANTRTNVIVADILEAPYKIAGFRQIGILKGDGGDDFGWKNCVIQSYSTTNGGKSAQVQVRNTGAVEAIINVSVNVLAFKTS